MGKRLTLFELNLEGATVQLGPRTLRRGGDESEPADAGSDAGEESGGDRTGLAALLGLLALVALAALARKLADVDRTELEELDELAAEAD